VADPVLTGSDVSSGTHRCISCGYDLQVQSTQHLPSALSCGAPNEWQSITGGGSVDDPYQDRN
jgi:hypothetical protein